MDVASSGFVDGGLCMSFPVLQNLSLENDKLITESGREQRKVWLNNLARATLDWIRTGQSLEVWLTSFQQLREQVLKMVWYAVIPKEWHEKVQYILLGSGGRREDLLYSDLDHALLLLSPLDEEINVYLYPFIRMMSEFGFPPCKGNVMSINPRWCGQEHAWQQRINSYFQFPNWAHVRYLSMFLDGRPMPNESSVGVEVWTDLVTSIRQRLMNSHFILWEMAHLGIHQTVALPRFGRHIVAIDFKEGFINPMIHSLRLLALSLGFQGASTSARIDFLKTNFKLVSSMMSQELLLKIEEALRYAWRLRLLQQSEHILQGEVPSDILHTKDWTHEQHGELIKHLHAAKELEQVIHHRFRKPR